MPLRLRYGAVALALLATAAVAAGAPADAPGALRELALAGNVDAIRPMGPRVLPQLVALYGETADPRGRATLAYVFYGLGWKSAAAKAALLRDIHTSDQTLRLQVQWALGRVSADPDVVDALLENMRHDASPLFRDKAACALAYDQIHLSPRQKLRLFRGLVDALEDPNLQVRQISLQALQRLTGQTKGFGARADAAARARAVAAWRAWLVDLEQEL
ncbi:MAG: hypothetical protein AB7O37_06440 [Vicinamibacteria bacterium]